MNTLLRYLSLLFLVVFSFAFSSVVHAANRYWVRKTGSPANWSDKNNWSAESGGIGGASVPGPDDAAFFNGFSVLNCTIDVVVYIKRFDIDARYTGVIAQKKDLYIASSGLRMQGGTFEGAATGFLSIKGAFELRGGTFKAPASMLLGGTFLGDAGNLFVYTGGEFQPNTSRVTMELSVSLLCSTVRGQVVASIPGLRFYSLIVSGSGPSGCEIPTFIFSGNPVLVDRSLEVIGGYLRGGRIEVMGSVKAYSDCRGGNTVVSLSGPADQSMSQAAASRLPLIELNKPAGSKVTTDYFKAQGLVVNSGELIVSKDFDIGGTWSFNTDLTLLQAGPGALTLKGLKARIGVDFQSCGSGRKGYISISDPSFRFWDLAIGTTSNACGAHSLELLDEAVLTVNHDLQFDYAKVDNGRVEAHADVLVTNKFRGGTTPLHFTGTTKQSFNLTGANASFDADVVIANGEAVVLQTPFVMDEPGTSLVLEHGIVVSSATNLLTLGDDVRATSHGKQSYVDGPLAKIGDDAFLFPVGKDGIYLPIAISAPSAVTDAVRAEYFVKDPSADGFDRTLHSPEIVGLAGCDYWMLTRVAGSGPLEVELYWESDPVCKKINALTDLTVARWNGTRWVNEGNVGTTGTSLIGSVRSAPVSDFSPFTLGSISAPLPIKWLNLSVSLDGRVAVVKWVMQSDGTFANMRIQRANTSLDFDDLGSIAPDVVPGHPVAHSFTDEAPLQGTSYYRLAITYKDGSTAYSGIVRLENNSAESQQDILIFPNPASSTVFLSTPTDVKVFDVKRDLVIEGKHLDRIDVGTWSDGTYWVWTPLSGFLKLVVVK